MYLHIVGFTKINGRLSEHVAIAVLVVLPLLAILLMLFVDMVLVLVLRLELVLLGSRGRHACESSRK